MHAELAFLPTFVLSILINGWFLLLFVLVSHIDLHARCQHGIPTCPIENRFRENPWPRVLYVVFFFFFQNLTWELSNNTAAQSTRNQPGNLRNIYLHTRCACLLSPTRPTVFLALLDRVGDHAMHVYSL